MPQFLPPPPPRLRPQRPHRSHSPPRKMSSRAQRAAKCSLGASAAAALGVTIIGTYSRTRTPPARTSAAAAGTPSRRAATSSGTSSGDTQSFWRRPYQPSSSGEAMGMAGLATAAAAPRRRVTTKRMQPPQLAMKKQQWHFLFLLPTMLHSTLPQTRSGPLLRLLLLDQSTSVKMLRQSVA